MRGFTTVELLIVLVVAALLAALAVPRLTDRTALQERGARDQLRAMIGHAQRIALTQQREVCVLTTPVQARAVYANAGACLPAAPLRDPAGGAAYTLDMPPGTVLGGATLLRFNSRGQPVPALDRTLSVGTLSITVYRETGLAL
ncbi:MAG: prepilin-type N-terminal cleavage/methylation domain-containing protein [Burkholderiaceae bacterium]